MIYECLFPDFVEEIFNNIKISIQRLEKNNLNNVRRKSKIVYDIDLIKREFEMTRNSSMIIGDYKTASSYFKEKNKLIRYEHYKTDSQISIENLNIEQLFILHMQEKLRVYFKEDKNRIGKFIDKLKQLYIFNSSLIRHYFNIKFSAMTGYKNAIKDHKNLIKKLKTKILIVCGPSW